MLFLFFTDNFSIKKRLSGGETKKKIINYICGAERTVLQNNNRTMAKTKRQ